MTNRLLEKSTELAQEQIQETCIHHWVIEPPEGPFSKGKCLKCGEEKEFQNYFPHSTWENEQKDDDEMKSLLNDWSV